ncbi:RNA-directed DNA polymerase, eukaryota [Tanacetum coccineum]
MSDSEHSTVTYTSVSEDDSDIGSPGVDGPPIMPEVPPSPDYIPGPEGPPSPDYVPGPEEPEQAPPSPIYIPFVPEPVYPEFLPVDDEVFPAEEQPMPAADSPTHQSPGYIPESDPEEDPEEDDEEDPEEDPADYPADRGDDDDDDDAEEEEHLAPADPAAVAYSADQDPYLAYRIPSRHYLYHHHHNGPTYVEGSLGSRAAGIRQRDALSICYYEAKMPAICLPHCKRSASYTPGLGYEVLGGSAAGRQTSKELGYGITDTWDDLDESLWHRLITVLYGNRSPFVHTGSVSSLSPWNCILKELNSLSAKGINLLALLKKKVGNGANTLFWEDCWINDVPLSRSFPRLYALELKKGITVADKLIDASFVASFRRNPRGGVEEEQLHHLVELVGSISLSPSNDRWAWLLGSSGEFSVHSARTFIDDILLPFVGDVTRWVKVVPIKVNILAWKVCLDKLPTRLNLSLRGIDIPSIICPNCGLAGESCSHLFYSCNLARTLWRKIARWWEIDILYFSCYEEWIA